eukprot:6192721-Pleurochrysis_carterae.AAC.6
MGASGSLRPTSSQEEPLPYLTLPYLYRKERNQKAAYKNLVQRFINEEGQRAKGGGRTDR